MLFSGILPLAARCIVNCVKRDSVKQLSRSRLHIAKQINYLNFLPVHQELPCSSIYFSTAASSSSIIINENLSFRSNSKNFASGETRPIVLIYGWLVAKSKHIQRYGDLYLDKGFDVLHIKIKPMQLLWPARAQEVISSILNFMNDKKHSQRPILIHGFSVGGYLYGEMLLKINDFPNEYKSVGSRIRGQIFDSPVDVHGIPYGMGQALANIFILQKMIQGSLWLYLKLFSAQTAKYYERSSRAYHENKLAVPSLFLYSSADKIAAAGPIEVVIDKWARHGIVLSKRWIDSAHVAHYLKYPVEYAGVLNQFIEKIDIDYCPDAKKLKKLSQ